MNKTKKIDNIKKSVQVDKDTWIKLKIISMSEEASINSTLSVLVGQYFQKKGYRIPEDN